MVRDVIGRHDEAHGGRVACSWPVMSGGVRLADGRVGLEEARVHAHRELERLPEALRSLAAAEVPYRVDISPTLHADRNALVRALAVS